MSREGRDVGRVSDVGRVWDVEVCVLGGGPAGAALATRLATLGHHVAVVEQYPFPRPHVGESLSPAVWPLLAALGVAEQVASAGFHRGAQARVRWRGAEEEVTRVEHGLTVDRARFDAILLDRARAAGATLVQPAPARRPVRHGPVWTVPVGSGVIRARFLADATGRRRLLSGHRTVTSPRTVALHAVWRGGPASGTRVEALADGWLWGAALPGDGFRAMAFVDPATLVAERDRLYHRLLGSSSLFADLPHRARRTGAVQVCDATSYATDTPVSPTSISVGEAAFAIDPLSSSGVQTAIQTALAAAATVHTLLVPGGDTAAALRYYTDHQHHSVRRHAASAAAVYADQHAHPRTGFWRRRAADAPPPPVPPKPVSPLRDLLPQRVRLVPDAALADTPCLVGDRIETRRALTHPALDRPVAFLGGTELAPFLDSLHAARTLAGALQSPDVLQTVTWLHSRALLVPHTAQPPPGSDSYMPRALRADCSRTTS